MHNNTLTCNSWVSRERQKNFSSWDLLYIFPSLCFWMNGLQDSELKMCHKHMAQNIIGCLNSQTTSEVQLRVHQKTQCSSHTNWTAVKCQRWKLTMQQLADCVNTAAQLILRAPLKMILCCAFTTASMASVAIFCLAALNSDLQPPSSSTTVVQGQNIPKVVTEKPAMETDWYLRYEKLQNFYVECKTESSPKHNFGGCPFLLLSSPQRQINVPV